ncbi:MAG: hypothetical protein ACKV2V_25080, partial [Blastocatellia bacterium]
MSSSLFSDTEFTVLSRATGGTLLNRQPQLDKLLRAVTGADPQTLLILGAPQSGKSELLKTAFDLLFTEQAQALPVYYQPAVENAAPEKLALDFLLTVLRAYMGFARRHPEMVGDTELQIRDLL